SGFRSLRLFRTKKIHGFVGTVCASVIAEGSPGGGTSSTHALKRRARATTRSAITNRPPMARRTAAAAMASRKRGMMRPGPGGQHRDEELPAGNSLSDYARSYRLGLCGPGLKSRSDGTKPAFAGWGGPESAKADFVASGGGFNPW